MKTGGFQHAENMLKTGGFQHAHRILRVELADEMLPMLFSECCDTTAHTFSRQTALREHAGRWPGKSSLAFNTCCGEGLSTQIGTVMTCMVHCVLMGPIIIMWQTTIIVLSYGNGSKAASSGTLSLSSLHSHDS